MVPSRSSTLAEVRANAFAAEILMPAAEVRAMATGTINREQLARLAWDFRVSPSAMATRLKALGVIKAEEHARLASLTTHEAAITLDVIEDHLNLTRESRRGWAPQRLSVEAITAYVRGRVGARLPAAVLGVDIDHFLDAVQQTAPALTVTEGTPSELVFTP